MCIIKKWRNALRNFGRHCRFYLEDSHGQWQCLQNMSRANFHMIFGEKNPFFEYCALFKILEVVITLVLIISDNF